MEKFGKIYVLIGFLIVAIFVVLSIIISGFITFILIESVIIPILPSIADTLISLINFLYSTSILILQFLMDVFKNVFDWFKDISLTIHSFIPHENLLVIIATVIATLIGISLPISVGIVGEQLAPYKDPDISNMFKQEKEFKILLYSVFSIPLFFLLHFFKINYSYLTFILLIGCIYFFYNFYKFIKKVFDYMIKTDEIILEKQKKTIEKIIK
jgi:hypothetical protein